MSCTEACRSGLQEDVQESNCLVHVWQAQGLLSKRATCHPCSAIHPHLQHKVLLPHMLSHIAPQESPARANPSRPKNSTDMKPLSSPAKSHCHTGTPLRCSMLTLVSPGCHSGDARRAGTATLAAAPINCNQLLLAPYQGQSAHTGQHQVWSPLPILSRKAGQPVPGRPPGAAQEPGRQFPNSGVQAIPDTWPSSGAACSPGPAVTKPAAPTHAPPATCGQSSAACSPGPASGPPAGSAERSRRLPAPAAALPGAGCCWCGPPPWPPGARWPAAPGDPLCPAHAAAAARSSRAAPPCRASGAHLVSVPLKLPTSGTCSCSHCSAISACCCRSVMQLSSAAVLRTEDIAVCSSADKRHMACSCAWVSLSSTCCCFSSALQLRSIPQQEGACQDCCTVAGLEDFHCSGTACEEGHPLRDP